MQKAGKTVVQTELFATYQKLAHNQLEGLD